MAIFSFIFFIGLILFGVGMVKPKVVIRWGPEEKRTRKQVAMTYLGVAIFSFILVGLTDDGSGKQKREQAAIEQQQKKAANDAAVVAATSAKKDQEEQQKKVDAAAKAAENKEKIQNTIKILHLATSRPNSAGGVDLEIVFKNVAADKTIKYCTFTAVPYNAVNDVVNCTIRRESKFNGKVTGPIAPGQTHGEDESWSCAWYNNTIKRAELTGVRIEYTDGSIVSIGQNDIPLIMPK